MPLILLKNLRSRAILYLQVKDTRTEFTVHILIHIAALISLPLLNLLSTKGLFLDSFYLLILCYSSVRKFGFRDVNNNRIFVIRILVFITTKRGLIYRRACYRVCLRKEYNWRNCRAQSVRRDNFISLNVIVVMQDKAFTARTRCKEQYRRRSRRSISYTLRWHSIYISYQN